MIGQRSASQVAGAGRLPVRPPEEYLPVADERRHLTVSPSEAERRNRTFMEIQERMSGVRRTGRQSAARWACPRATSRASQSRMGRQTGPAGAVQRMASQPAYVSNPRDVSGAGQVLSPRDRLTVGPRNAAVGQPPPARNFIPPMAALGGGQVNLVQRASGNGSPFQSHVPLTTAIARGAAGLPVAPQSGTNPSRPAIPLRPAAPSLPVVMLGHPARNVASPGDRGRHFAASPPVPFIGRSKPAISRAVFGSAGPERRLGYAGTAPVAPSIAAPGSGPSLFSLPGPSLVRPLSPGRVASSASPRGLARAVATPRFGDAGVSRGTLPASTRSPSGTRLLRPRPLGSGAVSLPTPGLPSLYATSTSPNIRRTTLARLFGSEGSDAQPLPAGAASSRATPTGTAPATTLPARTGPARTGPAGPAPARTTLSGTTLSGTTLSGTTLSGTAPAGTLPARTPPARTAPAGTAPPARTPPAGPAPARTPLAGPAPARTPLAGTARPPLLARTLAPLQPGVPRAQTIAAARGLTPAWATGQISRSVGPAGWARVAPAGPSRPVSAPVAGSPLRLGRCTSAQPSSASAPPPLAPSSRTTRTAGTVSPAGSLAGSWRPQGRPMSGPEYRIWRHNSGVFANSPSSFQPSAIIREPRGAPPNAVPPGANTLRRSELPLGVRPLFVPFPPAYPSKWVAPALTPASGPSAVTTRSPLMRGGGRAPGPGSGPVALARSLPHAISVAPPRISRVSQPILATTTTATVGRGTSPNIRGAPWPIVSGSPAHALSRPTTAPIVRPTFRPAATPAVQRARASFSPSTPAVGRDVRTPAHENVPARAHQYMPRRTHLDVRRAAFPRVPAPAFPAIPSSVLSRVPAAAFPSGQSPAILRAPAASPSKSATPPLASSLATAFMRSAPPALQRSSFFRLERATSTGSAEIQPTALASPTTPLARRTSTKAQIVPRVFSVTSRAGTGGRAVPAGGYQSAAQGRQASYVTSIAPSVMSARSGSRTAQHQPRPPQYFPLAPTSPATGTIARMLARPTVGSSQRADLRSSTHFSGPIIAGVVVPPSSPAGPLTRPGPASGLWTGPSPASLGLARSVVTSRSSPTTTPSPAPAQWTGPSPASFGLARSVVTSRSSPTTTPSPAPAQWTGPSPASLGLARSVVTPSRPKTMSPSPATWAATGRLARRAPVPLRPVARRVASPSPPAQTFGSIAAGTPIRSRSTISVPPFISPVQAARPVRPTSISVSRTLSEAGRYPQTALTPLVRSYKQRDSRPSSGVALGRTGNSHSISVPQGDGTPAPAALFRPPASARPALLSLPASSAVRMTSSRLARAGGGAGASHSAPPTMLPPKLAGGQRYAVQHPMPSLTIPGLARYPVVSRWPAPSAPSPHSAGGRGRSAAPGRGPSDARIGAQRAMTMKAGTTATARSAGANAPMGGRITMRSWAGAAPGRPVTTPVGRSAAVGASRATDPIRRTRALELSSPGLVLSRRMSPGTVSAGTVSAGPMTTGATSTGAVSGPVSARAVSPGPVRIGGLSDGAPGSPSRQPTGSSGRRPGYLPGANAAVGPSASPQFPL